MTLGHYEFAFVERDDAVGQNWFQFHGLERGSVVVEVFIVRQHALAIARAGAEAHPESILSNRVDIRLFACVIDCRSFHKSPVFPVDIVRLSSEP
ncbi:hypothetical protein SDC9_61327 [bioreactor metagenome]|uniref:Uncharacterized protein n=1 Tax=bioreactor metagenome TaxID=1076179 RepID=A0A644XL53_9ZZZZ